MGSRSRPPFEFPPSILEAAPATPEEESATADAEGEVEADGGMDCSQLISKRKDSAESNDPPQVVGRQTQDRRTFDPDEHLQAVMLEEDDEEDDQDIRSLGIYLRADRDIEMPETKIREVTGIWRTLMALGVPSTEAKSTLVEVYSPPRVTEVARRFPKYGVLPGGSYDLRAGPDGRSWDFS